MFLRGRKDDINIRGAFLHMAADAAVSLGVVIAAAAVMMTGWLWLDPAVSIAIALVITWGTWSLLAASVNLALDAVPQNIDPGKIEAYFAALPGVTEVHDLHIWAMSTTEVALTVHLVRPGAGLDDELAGPCLPRHAGEVLDRPRHRADRGRATQITPAGWHRPRLSRPRRRRPRPARAPAPSCRADRPAACPRSRWSRASCAPRPRPPRDRWRCPGPPRSPRPASCP